MYKIKTPNFDFLGMKNYFIVATSLLLGLSLFFYFTKGLNYGVDFKGGLKLLYKFETANLVDEAKIDQLLDNAGVDKTVVVRVGSANEGTFVLRKEMEQQDNDNVNLVVQKINAAFKQDSTFSNNTLLQNEFVGPKAGKDLRKKGQFAVIIACVVMLVYIGFRFNFTFGAGAIIAVIHDVFISIGVFALTGTEVNLTVIAAFLTIIGYSVNDTVVIFDRIRENLEKHKSMGFKKLVNLSLNETLSRTIVTSLTVFFVVVVLYTRADGDIQNFALAMIVGTILGTYSTIFVATPVYLWLTEYNNKKA